MVVRLAKAYRTTRMREVVGWAWEPLAGNGIVLDYDIGRFVADAEALSSTRKLTAHCCSGRHYAVGAAERRRTPTKIRA